MSKFIFVVLLIIAIINIVRALKEKISKDKFWGVTINVVSIILLVIAVTHSSCNKQK